MRFELTIPDPSTMRVGKEAYVSLAAGVELHRIHPSIFLADQFNDSATGDARFSPLYNRSNVLIRTAYAAESFECAVCEVILRCPDVPPLDPRNGLPPFQIVYPRDFAAYSHSILRTAAPLNLLDLTNAGQRKIGISHNALLAGPRSTYPATRSWAERIHGACTSAQGIYYNSFQYGPHYAVLLFGDRVAPTALEPVSTRSIADPECHGDIRAVAESLSIEYEDV